MHPFPFCTLNPFDTKQSFREHARYAPRQARHVVHVGTVARSLRSVRRRRRTGPKRHRDGDRLKPGATVVCVRWGGRGGCAPINVLQIYPNRRCLVDRGTAARRLVQRQRDVCARLRRRPSANLETHLCRRGPCVPKHWSPEGERFCLGDNHPLVQKHKPATKEAFNSWRCDSIHK